MSIDKKLLKATVHKGMPEVKIDLDPHDALDIQIKLKGDFAEKIGETPIQITLESLHVDLHHNQSYGMIRASTGCISNPGGPSC